MYLLLLISLSHALLGVDVSQYVSQPDFQCLHSKEAVDWVIVRCYRSVGSVDDNCISSIHNAFQAGIPHIDIYHFPDTSQDPVKQVEETLKHLKGISFEKYWLDIEDFAWPKNTTWSIEFIQNMVTTLKKAGQTPGIYTGRYSWPYITNNSSQFSNLPLWYAHYEVPPNPSFSDYGNKPGQLGTWGGWITPYAKQYKGTTTDSCASNFDRDWRPSD